MNTGAGGAADPRDSASRRFVFRLHSPRNSTGNAPQTPIPLVPPPPSSSTRTRASRPGPTLHVQYSPRASPGRHESPREGSCSHAFDLEPWDSFTPFSAVKHLAQSPHDSDSSSKHLQPSALLMSPLDEGGSWAAATSVDAATEHWADFAAAPEHWTHAAAAPEQWTHAAAAPEQCAVADEWAEVKFDSASISIIVSDVDWAQSNQESTNSNKPSVEKRTIFLSLSRVLKLFKSQSRSALLQRAFYTWHNLLRMRERRRWVTCFCQKMCRRLILRWAFSMWKCAAVIDSDDDSFIQPDPFSSGHKSEASSPSISLSELQSSFQSESPDFERVITGFRQQLQVQTLKEKLRKDCEQLQQTISVLKLQVPSQGCAGDDEGQADASREDGSSLWQRRMEKFQSDFRTISLENLELKRVVSQQQSHIQAQQMSSIHRAEADIKLQSQLAQDKAALQRQVASFQQQFCELCDHPAVTSVVGGDLPPSPSFTNIRTALDSITSRNRPDSEARKFEHERAELQRRLDAASCEVLAALLENEELKQSLSQLRIAAESNHVRAVTSDAAVKFLAAQHKKGREEVEQLQRQLHALTCEVQPAFARSTELRQRVGELEAALQGEQARHASARARCEDLEARCQQLDALCSELRADVQSNTNSSKAAASARLSAMVTAIMLNEVKHQLLSDEVESAAQRRGEV